uniref:Putative ABC transporter permease protein ytcP n=1 Tax=uncultured bacterium contig00207 TaxID=1181610 RepID=A0A806KL66_9BACT|nr:putative ABC transporter permease protein ytcP [uncultured bacterium contig00207]
MNIGQKRELKTGDWVVVLVCIVVILLCILPMINLLAQSLSSAQSVINSRVKFIPMVHNMEDNSHKFGVTLESYRYVFLDKAFARSMWWTAILTVICTIVSLSMTILCAYPLTYDWLKGKYFINTLIIFTMYFSAGTIPNYVLMKSLGLLNNPLVLIIPNCLSVFNMIILRSFFFGIPDSLRESAEIDGANPFTVLVRIYLPLSGPVLATLALFYAVGRWNGFGDALLYINAAPQWVPIQLKLWQLIQNQTSIDLSTVEMVAGTIPRASDAIKAAAIMFATVPILIVYPWLQRYFIAGVTIGAVKG